jgi:hypothetical protein
MEEDAVAHPEWNEALEIVIKKEGEQAQALFWLHNHAAAFAGRYNDYIQIPAIILATATGFFSATADLIPPVGIGALSVLVGILNTINSYFKFSQRSEGHRIASLLYYKTYKNIETQLSIPIEQRQPADIFLKQLRDEMTRVSETAPIIPEKTLAAFKEKFADPKVSVPIIANGLDPISVWKSPVRTPVSTPKERVKVNIVV